MLCETVRLRTHLYYRIAEDDPPNQFAPAALHLENLVEPCSANKHRPADAGDARAGPVPALRGLPKGGDG